MHWGLRLIALAGVTAALRFVAVNGPVEARATLALGFLLLAAHVAGELAARVRVPRLTAALLVGFAAGPSWLDIVHTDEVASLQYLSDAALALLGVGAGLWLRFDHWRREGSTVIRQAVAAVSAPFAAVAVVALSVSPWFPLTRHQPFGDGLAVALVLGSVAAASGPVVVGVLLEERHTVGPWGRGIVAVSAAQTVLAVVLFALALAVAAALAGAGAADAGVAAETLGRLVGSVALGAALGAACAAVLAARGWSPLVLIGALALAAAEAARSLGLEPALFALAAGCTLGSRARPGPEVVRAALAPAAGPALLGFFALTGAGSALTSLGDLWPWVVLFAGLRAVGLWGAGRGVGRSGEASTALADPWWVGVISQGPVVLGLAGVARRAFPEWGVSLEALIVGLGTVNLLGGPVAFYWAVPRGDDEREDVYAVADAGARLSGAAAGDARAGLSG